MKQTLEKPNVATQPCFGKELAAGRFIRDIIGSGGRIHVDRPLPFICVHVRDGKKPALAAEELTASQASHILADRQEDAAPILADFARAMAESFENFLVVVLYELNEDRRLADDSPILPDFKIALARNHKLGAPEAAAAFSEALRECKMRYHRPFVVEASAPIVSIFEDMPHSAAVIDIGIAPIYRQPASEDIYPELLQQLVAILYDAILKAIFAFANTSTTMKPKSHRALGRKMIIDAVHRVDRLLDAVSSSFDLLLHLTPINTDHAWQEFKRKRFAEAPLFYYRPLAFDVAAKKRELFSISLHQLEDPVLSDLFDEKRRELDLQLTMLNERGTDRAKDAGRVMYGSIEPDLKSEAESIIRRFDAMPGNNSDDSGPCVGASILRKRAEDKMSVYRRSFDAFSPKVEIRDDIPAGLMVSGSRLLISQTTAIPEKRVEAIISHEIGVHLVTYFNGQEQGLRLLRSGLAGYEGMQEGLAVFAEYAVGGFTRLRLRLLAARVLACEAMLAGANFSETFDLLTSRCGLTARSAFHAAMRVHRSGGLAKDCIYLRGLMQVLHHLRNGGGLEVFWIGKIASRHFPIMTELLDRGLLKPIPLIPDFISKVEGKRRIELAASGLTPFDLVCD